MKPAKAKPQNTSGLSNGLRIALIATVALTLLSFGIKKWRQSSEEQTTSADVRQVEESTEEGATAAPKLHAGLRPDLKAASNNPMGRRNASTSAVETAQTPDQAPPPPPPPPPPQELKPPTFHLIGVHVDGKRWTAFFSQGNRVIAARPKTRLPDGFFLQTVNTKGATVIRTSNREKIEMPLEMPK